MDLSSLTNMNGLQIASVAAQIAEQFIPLIAKGISTGLTLDPTLARQLQAAKDLADQTLANAIAAHEALNAETDKRLGK